MRNERDDYVARASVSATQALADLYDAWDVEPEVSYGSPLDKLIDQAAQLVESIDKYRNPFNHPITIGGDA